MWFCRPFNNKSWVVEAGGFSLPGVLVGVGLLGVSAVVISNTVVDARRSQQVADIKLSANKLQQAILDAVTGRIKEFMLDKCSGARWGGGGSTEVEKAFSRIEIPIGSASSDGTPPALKFYKLAGDIPTSFSCDSPVGPARMDPSNANSGQYLRFCMTVDPPGHPAMAQRLLELLIVPINLASDSAITCQDTRGAGAGIKVTWQMHNKINKNKVKGFGDGVSVLKESGTFLISAETESYSGTCKVDANRVGTTNQCKIDVSGLGRRPPTLFKNNVVMTGFNWVRSPSANNDAFTATTMCETNLVSNFRVQSTDGSVFCDAQPVPIGCTSPYPGYACTLDNTQQVGNFNGGARDSCHRWGSNAVSNAGTMTINGLSRIIGDKIFSNYPGSQDDVVLLLKSSYTVPGMTGTGTVAVPSDGLFFYNQQNGGFDGCNNTYTYMGRSVQRSAYGNTAGLAAGLSAPLVGPYSISISQLKGLGYANGDSLSFNLWLIAQGAGGFSLGLVIPKCTCQ